MSRGGRRLKWGSEPTTTTNLDGIWGLNEINNLIGQTKWPRGPVAPTSLTTTVGVAQLSLSWTAPATTHGTITNYLVEYTASGGSAQYVLTNSTSTSYTLTGLTNGTAYTVRVAAVNFTAGDYSATATGTPTAFAGLAVILTSGSSYTVPAGAFSMKVWAIGGGSGGSEAPDGGNGTGGVPAAIAVKTYSVLGGQTVTYSIGGVGPWNRGCEGQYGGSTSVTYNGSTVVGGGGIPVYCGGGNVGCTNADTCGVAGNNVSNLNSAVSLSGSSLGNRGLGDNNGAVVLYFT